jgi:hypothetical protein
MAFKWFFGSDKSHEAYLDDIEQRFQEKLDKMKQRKQNMSTSEPYRVGVTVDGKVTLTLISDPGNSITMTMSPEACEAMIRILRATYTTEKETKNEL